MKTTLLLLCLSIYSSIFAQTFNLTNQQLIGCSTHDYLSQVIPTADGGKLLLYTSFNNDGNRNSSNYGNSDFWVVKLNSLYMIEWENSYGGDQYEFLNAAVELPDGSFILGGSSMSMTGTGIKSATTFGGNDYWIVKISSTGTYFWDKSFGTNGNDILHNMVLKNDTLLLCGSSDGGIDGSKTMANYGADDIWMIGVDLSGNELLQKSFGGILDDNNTKMKNFNGKIVISSRSNSGVSGNKTTPNYGSVDSWLIHLNNNFDIQFENTFGGLYSDFIYDMEEKDGSYYYVGSSSSPTGGTKTSPKFGNVDGWVIKTTPDFLTTYQYSYGNVGNYFFNDIYMRNNGKIILAGTAYEDSLGIWKSRSSRGESDFYLIGLNENGNYEWNYSWGGSKNDLIIQFFESSNNQFWIFGESNSSNSGDIYAFNHDQSSLTKDGYWCTMNTNLGLSPTNSNVYQVFPNPSNETISIITNEFDNNFARIVDLNGKLMHQFQLSKPESTIDIREFKPGIYFLQIDNSISIKIVKI